MLRQLEGSRAVAEAVAACRPEVVAAYPISPQTHIVEGLAALVAAGTLERCEYLNVESEFAAMSVAIGASAAGARTYTATASQGLLYMAEALYNASGLGLPIVMTVANRAIGAPINIWNDHSDAMSQRDSGWIQLFADSNQEAVDLHVQAFRLAEELSLPVMVCMDGFVLTHAHERLELPTAQQVDSFLPPFAPRQVLDPADPVTIGAMVGPDAFMEVRYLANARMRDALEAIPRLAGDFGSVCGREAGGLLRGYRLDHAETVLVALGSVVGSIEDVVDARRGRGEPVGALSLRCYRPFPLEALRAALSGASRVIAVEKAFAPGLGGILGTELRAALRPDAELHDVVMVRIGPDLMTGRPGVFAGGDIVPAERTVTMAVGHGKAAARSIDAWLRGRRAAIASSEDPIPFDALNPWYYSDAPRSVRPRLELARRQSTFDEVTGGLDASTALFEARRCLSCGSCFACDNCFGICPDNAIIKLHPAGAYAYAIDLDYCKGCGLCAQECPAGAIQMSPEEV
jgi:pyruvate ferredoxin oxidoreductase alpha subunit